MKVEPIYIPSVTLSNALSGVRDPSTTRDTMAELYADCLCADLKDWLELNTAIQERWPKGLAYIKKKAWSIALDRE